MNLDMLKPKSGLTSDLPFDPKVGLSEFQEDLEMQGVTRKEELMGTTKMPIPRTSAAGLACFGGCFYHFTL